MICPFYKNKEVFDGFNEMIEAFGGRPMTEEEFRDSALRNQRTGRDFAAMEAAYTVYNRNNGNFLDKAPNGNKSVLFQSLLDINEGDHRKAIIQKSNVYSDAFFNWFGDWTLEDKESVSKVVDENGEPLVVWHHTDDKNLKEFKLDFINYFQKDGGTNKAFFFDENTHGTLNRKYDLPVYLNIKELSEYEGTKEDLHKQGTSYRAVVNKSAENNDTVGGVHMKNFDDNKLEHQSIWITHSPNQIKHVANLGTWSTTDNDINNIIVDKKDTASLDILNVANLNQFETASLSMFGTDIMSRLLNNGNVTTDELIDYLFSTRSVSINNMLLADILRRHKISVTLDGRIGQFTLATTITNSAGLSVIALNPNLIDQVSRGYLCEAILHECVHSVTVDAINNPRNGIQKQFSELNNRVFNLLLKALPKNSALLNDVDLGLYALKNEKEFAAVFITNADARDTFYKIARGIDVLKNGYVLNTIKRFINNIAELFINKDLFNTNEALLNEYKSKFYNHLLNTETKTPIKLTKQQLYQIHDNIDIKTANTESLIDGIKYLENTADAIERNDIRIISIKRKNKDVDRVYSFDDITNKLTIRINALRTSDMERLEKTKYINDALTQIEMFKNQQTSKYIAITSTLKQIVPNILKDVRELKNINMDPESSISANEFMYLMHSNIGMYRSIAETMLGLINQLATRQLILEEYNSGVPEDLKLKESDIEELKGSIQDVKNLADEGIVVLNILRSRTAINILRQRALNSGYSEDMEKYIENITENPTYDDDINWFEKWLGPMDSAQNEVLRVLSNIVKGALDTADKKVINKTVDLLELQSKLKSGENVIDLYEKFDDGTTSGYIVRKLHYGKFYRDFDEELRRINKLFSKVLNKKLDDSLRTAPHNNDLLTDDQLKQLGLKDLVGEKISILLGWNELKNRWLSEHCERKYNKKYYDAWNRVPQVAKDALDSINAEISSLLSQDRVRGDDGYYHYDKLSDEDWDLFLNLTILKKLLRSYYDMFGNKKQPGSLEYEISHSLQELSINLSLISMEKKDPSRYKEVLALYKKYQQTLSEDDFAAVRNACYQTEISKNKEAWLKAVDNLIEECGGVESYNKWKAGENGHGFNVKKFKKWHLRNSRLEFKRDEEGNAIVFKDIEAAMLGFVVDYGSRYELLKNKERELLRPYKAQNGEVIASELPEAVKNLLLELYEEEYQIREQAKEDNPQLKELSKKYKEVFDLFIVFKDTEYYKQIMKQIKNSATDEDGNFDVSVYDALMENYGRYGDPDESGIVTEFVPYRWLLRMEAVDVDKYMEYEPNNAWSEKADDSSILNPNFDESENSAFVPKKELYDNSKLFNKIYKGSKGIQDLYAAIVSTMEEANKMLANRTYADTYQLPGITGSLWKRIKNHGFVGACKVLGKCLLELLGLSRNPEDFSEAGTNLALDNIDSEGNVSNSISPIKGKYPDGRTFHILPQYYTRRMEDPSQISADLINIVVNYYRMACYYDEKVKIKDDCETLVDFLKEDRGTKISNRQFGENSKNSEYNAFKAGEKFLEMNLYNLKRSNTTFNLGPIQFLWSKLASSWKTWTTRRNLGLNPKVALTGFLTTMGVHIINSITGQNYGKEGAYAFVEVLRRVFQSALGARYLGNPLSNDDMMVMAEVFGIADQFEKKIEGTNNNRFVYAAYKNSIFGMLSTVDFWTKSMIMVATLMNHHYVNGRFLSKDDIRSSRYLYKTKKEFKKALDEWEKGDNLYHLLVSKNHRLTIDDKYKSAYEHDFDVIKNRIQKTAEYADGMATDLQRSAISQSVIGAFILIHRQYLPLIISRYYGKRVYDYDTRMYKNGIFRTLFDFICVVMLNNLLAGIGVGAFTGFAFGGPIGAIAGTFAAVGTRAYGQYRRNKSGEKSKKLKDIYNERFSDFSTERSTRNSYANRYAMKEISATVIGYHLLVVPIVNWVCSMAEDDDDDKWWLLLLAYAMRSFLWEFYTAFRTDDMLNNIKTPSAATSVLDAAEDVVYVASSSLASQTFLYDPSLTIDDWKHLFGTDEVVLRGAYEDWTKLERGLMKTWAGHNMYEQLMDSKTKRHWQESQVMRIRN